MLKRVLYLIVILFISLCSVQRSHARRNTITSGLVVAYDYDKTNNERNNHEDVTPDDEEYLEHFSIAPLFILETTSQLDNLTINFNPSFVYDQVRDQHDIDNNVEISAYRFFSRKIRIDLSDTFIYSDDPELIEDENRSNYNQNRRRYKVNDFNCNATYNYGVESFVATGYRYEILRNEETGPGGYEDYDRHNPTLSLQHRFNPLLNVNVMWGYTRGIFYPPAPAVIEESYNNDTISNDLSEYSFTPRINYILSRRNTLWFSHDYTLISYDALLRPDSYLYEFTLGSEYHHTRRLSFEVDGGPSYEQTDGLELQWGYNAHLGFNYDIDRNSILTASITKGYDEQNFSSANTALGRSQGFNAFWELEMSLVRELDTGLTGTAFFSYRRDEHQEYPLDSIANTPDTYVDRETLREESILNRTIYEGGCSLGYNFLRWYSADLRYTYSKQESELIEERYDEHRIYLTFSIQKEVLRW
ncbi:MAG: hypothetical protein QTN59_19435 [Candidatus Electrothrix communis]|nr:MAG: hypothetical protein QTN59_19435 [Candidatus Electrothrix communis]